MLNCYYMDIACSCSHEQLQDLCTVIPDDRMEKINRLKNADIAVKHMISNAFLQYGLSVALGVPAKEISYQYGNFGKPMLSDYAMQGKGNTDFNLTHSGKYAVLAVSDSPVGIDVERKKRNRIMVAKRCFCEEEYKDIMAASSEMERDKRFLEYWTMKESYIKRSGEGLHAPLNSFLIKRQENSLSYIEGEGVYFATVFCKKEPYCVSICSDKKDELERIQGCSCDDFSEFMCEIRIGDIIDKG